jgi:pimeloyl-ACP methyl ester carboxylesterase
MMMSAFTFPASFKTQEITTNGVNIHTRVGGAGPAVVLLHGYGELSARQTRELISSDCVSVGHTVAEIARDECRFR